jgi:hypothetical protein
MLYLSKGIYHVSCDSCPEVETLETSYFKEAKAEMKKRGWRAFKEGDDWQHICKSCDN